MAKLTNEMLREQFWQSLKQNMISGLVFGLIGAFGSLIVYLANNYLQNH